MIFLQAKIVNTFFILLLLAVAITHCFISIPFYIYFLLGLIWLTLTTIGSFNILWNYHLPSLNSNPHCTQSQIAITFDDGPHPTYTPQVLALLKQYNAKATFFCIGKNVEAHPDLLKKIIKEGHIVGNHSYTHSDFFGFFNTQQVLAELNKTNAIIKKYTGQDIQLFRPPFGVTNPSIKKALLQSSYISIGWNVRSLDTVIKNPAKIYHRITKNLKSGDIILLHDTSSRTVETLEKLLIFLKQKQLKAVTVKELLELK